MKQFFIFFLVFCNLSFNLYAARYYVKPDGDDFTSGLSWETAFATLTKAADVATSGSEVWVAGGTYQEGAEITIPEGVSFYGGFLGTENSLEQRKISLNSSIIDGEAAHRCVHSYGTIDGFHVTNGYGQGISNRNGTVTNCVLYMNSSQYGGGIYNLNGTVTNCKLYLNSSEYYGGGIYNRNGTITNCILYSNSSGYYGGGIHNQDGIVVNCTLYSNSADVSGGGISNINGTIINCISWKSNNGDIDRYGTSIKFSCYGEARGKDGNINCNPIFMNTSGEPLTWDFHLQNGSPCIDAGTTDTAELPGKDMEGTPRPGEDGKVCMGAYESPDHYLPLPAQPTTRIYVSKTGNNTNGESWQNAYTSISSALSSIGDSLYEIFVEKGTYQEGDAVSIPGQVKLYGGFAGTEESFPDERDIEIYQSIIDGEDSYCCMVNCGIVDGMYITRGEAETSYGGGVYNFSGVLANCRIYNNKAEGGGGGIFNRFGDVYGCHVFQNEASPMGWACDGGGIYNFEGLVENCIVYGNYAISGGGSIIPPELSQLAGYSIIVMMPFTIITGK